MALFLGNKNGLRYTFTPPSGLTSLSRLDECNADRHDHANEKQLLRRAQALRCRFRQHLLPFAFLLRNLGLLLLCRHVQLVTFDGGSG